MFGMMNFFKAAFKKKEEAEPTVAIDTNEEDYVYVQLATEPDDDDFVMINRAEFQQEFSVQELVQQCELMAKQEVYKLAIPEEKHSDKALAAQKRFENQGLGIHVLSSKEAQEKGVYLYALVNNNDPQAPITVLCRGTGIDASLVADLDPDGPGAAIMKQNREHMLTILNGLCERFPNRKICVTGHSFGGSLSQIVTAEVLAEVAAHDSTYPELKKISGIDTVVFQSAGISTTLADEAQKHAKKIKSLDHKFNINFVAHVKEGDLVSKMGSYLFADIDSDIVNVSLYSRALGKPMLTLGDWFDIGLTAATTANPMMAATVLTKNLVSRSIRNRLEAHTDFFHYEPKNGKLSANSYGFLSNANPKDRDVIKKIFQENMMDSPYLKNAQTALHGILGDLDNSNVDGIITCTSAAMVIAGTGLSLANAASPMQAAMIAAKQANKVAKAVENINEHQENGLEGMAKIFEHFSGTANSKNDFEEERPPSCRAG